MTQLVFPNDGTSLPETVEVLPLSTSTAFLAPPCAAEPSAEAIEDEHAGRDTDECECELLRAEEVIEREEGQREVGLAGLSGWLALRRTQPTLVFWT